MSVRTFWDDAFVPTGVTTGTTVPSNRGMTFVSMFPGTVTSIQFWKLAGDTGTHIGYLWRVYDQALLGSVTFTGETASGWQTMAFTPAISIQNGVRYIATVSHTVQYAQQASFVGVAGGALTMDAGGVSNTTPASFPSTPQTTGYLVDVIVSDTSAAGTFAGAPQALAEVWLRSAPPQLDASQAVAEVWVRQIPITAVVASQALVEVWQEVPPSRRIFWLSAQTL
jgi:hypothetical protein